MREAGRVRSACGAGGSVSAHRAAPGGCRNRLSGPAPLPKGPLRQPDLRCPGLNAAFDWANAIPTPALRLPTRQYPLYGTDLSNDVPTSANNSPTAASPPPATCHRWRNLLNDGHYDYVIATATA